jgi:diguanylate cyclase (GGDEF)-like protein
MEGVHDLAVPASTVLRVTLATLASAAACRGKPRSLWVWAAFWWLAALAPWAAGRLGPLPQALALLLVLPTWSSVWHPTTGARRWVSAGSGLLSASVLLGVAPSLAPALARTGDPRLTLGIGLAGELLVGSAVLLSVIETARSQARVAEERRAMSESRLMQTVTWDPLTECFTRPVFRELVDRVRDGQDDDRGVILVIDMDGLKRINDTSGHSAGDKAIRRTGLAIKRRLRDRDLALRWGGDEFVAVLRGISLAEGRQVRRRIVATLRREGLSASVGLAVYGVGSDIVSALREADARMYAIKRRRHQARARDTRQLELPLEPPRPESSRVDASRPLAVSARTSAA